MHPDKNLLLQLKYLMFTLCLCSNVLENSTEEKHQGETLPGARAGLERKWGKNQVRKGTVQRCSLSYNSNYLSKETVIQITL
jgi:hypothetical protein